MCASWAIPVEQLLACTMKAGPCLMDACALADLQGRQDQAEARRRIDMLSVCSTHQCKNAQSCVEEPGGRHLQLQVLPCVPTTYTANACTAFWRTDNVERTC